MTHACGKVKPGRGLSATHGLWPDILVPLLRDTREPPAQRRRRSVQGIPSGLGQEMQLFWALSVRRISGF